MENLITLKVPTVIRAVTHKVGTVLFSREELELSKMQENLTRVAAEAISQFANPKSATGLVKTISVELEFDPRQLLRIQEINNRK